MASRRHACIGAAELALLEYTDSPTRCDTVYRAAMLSAVTHVLEHITDDERIVYQLEYIQHYSAEHASLESCMSRSSYYRARWRLHNRVANELLK